MTIQYVLLSLFINYFLLGDRNMKERFDFPEITIYSFSASDIVTTSPIFPDGEGGDNEIGGGLIPDGQ